MARLRTVTLGPTEYKVTYSGKGPIPDDIERRVVEHLVLKENRLNAADIRFLRAYSGMTQENLADTICATRQSVLRWESGQINIPWANDRLLRVSMLPYTSDAKAFEATIDSTPDIGKFLEDSEQTLRIRQLDYATL